MFTMHPFSMTTQWTYHHWQRIYASAWMEIANHNWILFTIFNYFWNDMIYLCIAKIEMLVGGKIFVIRTCLVSHLFCCWIEILNINIWQILFLFWVFIQAFTFTNLLTRTNASWSKRFMKWHLEKRKPASFYVVTSSWVKYVLSYTSHIKGTTCLPIVYFLPVPPTKWLWSSW